MHTQFGSNVSRRFSGRCLPLEQLFRFVVARYTFVESRSRVNRPVVFRLQTTRIPLVIRPIDSRNLLYRARHIERSRCILKIRSDRSPSNNIATSIFRMNEKCIVIIIMRIIKLRSMRNTNSPEEHNIFPR